MQRIEFNLQSALDGAKLVTRDGQSAKFVKYEERDRPYQLVIEINGRNLFFTKDGKWRNRSNIPNDLDLFLAVPYTDIIGNSITEPPMMTAEAWLLTQPMSEKVDWSEYDFANKYGNYVADYLTKNK